MQEFLACLIYYTVVVLIPLRETYLAFKSNASEETFSLWGNYWAIFCFVGYFRNLIGFLTYQPFTFLFLLFLLWCYHSDYKVSFFSYAGSALHQPINQKSYQDQSQRYQPFEHSIFDLFENDPAIQESKPKAA